MCLLDVTELMPSRSLISEVKHPVSETLYFSFKYQATKSRNQVILCVI